MSSECFFFLDNKEPFFFTGTAIAIVAGVAIVIGMLIVTVGLVIFKRYEYYTLSLFSTEGLLFD